MLTIWYIICSVDVDTCIHLMILPYIFIEMRRREESVIPEWSSIRESIKMYIRVSCIYIRHFVQKWNANTAGWRLYVANAVVLCNTSTGRLHITGVALRAKASRHLTRRPQIYPATTRATYCTDVCTRTISRLYKRV